MQDTNLNQSDAKQNLDSVETFPQSVSKKGEMMIKRRDKSSNFDQNRTSSEAHFVKNARNGEKSVQGSKIPSISEMAKTGVILGIEFKNSEIPEEIFTEEFGNMIDLVKSYNMPNLNKNIPFNILLSVQYEGDSTFGEIGIEKISYNFIVSFT